MIKIAVTLNINYQMFAEELKQTNANNFSSAAHQQSGTSIDQDENLHECCH